MGSDRVSRAVRLRDLLLTALAWCAFAWMLRDAIALAIDWFREPSGQLTHLQPPDWPRAWQRLRNGVVVAALLAAWLGFWAVYRSKALRRGGTTQAAGADGGGGSRRAHPTRHTGTGRPRQKAARRRRLTRLWHRY